jgi:hypothetical protein
MNNTAEQVSKKSIKFNFRPYEQDKGNYAIEKADTEGGSKRKYLRGITSGTKIDGHGERMTNKAISSFMRQANSGDILLYPDVHGIKESEDIGILTKAEIKEDGDWFTEYRLYDEADDIGPNKLEKINDIWKQSTGAAPYKKPKQKGFSIEGDIPENGILEAVEDPITKELTNRVIDEVMLNGTILVPKPAYKDGIAHSVYKALGEMTPFKKKAVRKGISEKIQDAVKDKELENEYFKSKWEINDAFDQIIEDIMKGKDGEGEKRQQLEIAFEEYKNLMVDLIMRSQSLFVDEDTDEAKEDSNAFGSSNSIVASKSEVFKALLGEFEKLEKSLKSRRK